MYHATIRVPLWIIGHILNLFDRYVVDLSLVDGIAKIPRALGRGFQPLHNGILHSYAISMAGGATLVAILVFLLPQLVELLNGMFGGQG